MSQSVQRQRRNEKTFEDLPPRVVIYDILNYVEVEIDSAVPEFDLFGYYKRDRRRSIWFLFQALNIPFSKLLFIGSEDIMTFPVVKLEKLHSLHLGKNYRGIGNIEHHNTVQGNIERKKVLSGIIETFKRTNMFLLKRLSINHSFEYVDFTDLFSPQNQVGKLRHLELSSDRDNFTKDWKWDKQSIKSLQENLVSLKVSTSMSGFMGVPGIPDVGLRILGNGDTFTSLKRVCFTHVYFTSKRTIRIPHLEEVFLDKCQNLVIIPGTKVFAVNYCKNQPNDVKELFLRSKRIKHLSLHSCELFNDSNDWFWNESTNPMEHLCSLSLNAILGSNEILEIFLQRIKGQISEFEINDCDGLPEDLLDEGFEKLEMLKIIRTSKLLRNKRNWNLASQIKELYLQHLSHDFTLRSNLFFMNHFSSLELLEMVNCDYTTYSNMSGADDDLSIPPLENLKVIRSDRSDLGDIFFIDHDLEKLEMLEFSGSKITGKGWKRTKFEKLREVSVRWMKDDLFKLIEFPALRKLKLGDCVELTGEGWLPMPKLCELNVRNCRRFSKERIL